MSGGDSRTKNKPDAFSDLAGSLHTLAIMHGALGRHVDNELDQGVVADLTLERLPDGTGAL